MHWVAGIISLGAVFATTSVLIVFQMGQPRIFFSMARDGLLPQWAAKVHPKYKTPHVTTILTGVFVGLLAGLANIDEIVELTNIGTLFAFVLVAVGILVLRHTNPDAPRPFRAPLVPLVPALAHPLVRLPDVPAPVADVGAVLHLARHRPGGVLRLRLPPQQAARPERGTTGVGPGPWALGLGPWASECRLRASGEISDPGLDAIPDARRGQRLVVSGARHDDQSPGAGQRVVHESRMPR